MNIKNKNFDTQLIGQCLKSNDIIATSNKGIYEHILVSWK